MPASRLRSAIALNEPRPPDETANAAVDAGTKSSSLASEVPPGANARKRTSSSLKSVGLTTTVAPFESVHWVTPTAGYSRVAVIVPAPGGAATSGWSDTVST